MSPVPETTDSPFSQPPAPASNPFRNAEPPEGSFAIAPAPDWIWEREVTWEMPVYSDEHVSFLLSDSQFAPEIFSNYERSLKRLNTHEAVQKLSQIEIDFDPETERLEIHELRIWRQGHSQSYADPKRFFFRQRESSLEAHIFTGRISAMLVLDDVRSGDIIELAFSLITTCQLEGKKAEYIFTLDRALPTAAWYTTLFLPKDAPMPNYRQLGGEPQSPQAFEAGENLIWVWSGSRTQVLIDEPNVPSWEPTVPLVHVSFYGSWAEAVAVLETSWKPIYATGSIHADMADPDGAEAPLEERALRLIRMVQDDVRYLGLSMGLGGVLPSPPPDVLRRRYGDCKDKSLLLCALLRSLGLDATPVLVHTTLCGASSQFLPGLSLFNHVIVTCVINEKRIFIDATMRGAGGGLFDQTLPEYSSGLCIAEDTTDLISIPPAGLENARWLVREDFYVDAGGGASFMDLCIEASGANAEFLRGRLAFVGRETFTKVEAEALQASFPDLRPEEATPLMVTDDRESNFIMIEARFVLTNWGEAVQNFRVFHYHPRWIGIFLGCPPEHPPRKHSFLLQHPLQVRHEITVHGTVCAAPPEDFKVECQWFRYRVQTRVKENKSATFEFMYQARQKIVQAAWVTDFRKQFDKMAKQSGMHVAMKPKKMRSSVPAYVKRKPALKPVDPSFKVPPPIPGNPGLRTAPPSVPAVAESWDSDFQPEKKRWGMSSRTRWNLKKNGWLVFVPLGVLAGVIGGISKSPETSRTPASPSSIPMPDKNPVPASVMPRPGTGSIPPIQDPAMGLAEAALKKGDLATAIANLEALEKTYHGHPSLALGWALVELYRGNPELSRKWSLEALEKIPDFPMAVLTLGHAELMQGRYAEAEKHFESVYRTNPTNPDPLIGLMKAQVGLKKMAEAEESAQSILKMDPLQVEALRYLVLIRMGKKDNDGALAAIRSSLEKAPGVSLLHCLHADIFNELGRGAEQLEAVETGLKQASGDPALLIRKARALAQLQRGEEAAQVAQATLLLSPNHIEANQMAGAIYADLGKFPEALKASGKMVELQPGLPLAHNHYGYTLLLSGDTVKAREQFEKALQLDPNFVVALENLRNMAVKEGDTERVNAYDEKIKRLKPVF